MPTVERDICRIRAFVRAGILLVVGVGGLVVCSLACAVVLFRGWRRSVGRRPAPQGRAELSAFFLHDLVLRSCRTTVL